MGISTTSTGASSGQHLIMDFDEEKGGAAWRVAILTWKFVPEGYLLIIGKKGEQCFVQISFCVVNIVFLIDLTTKKLRDELDLWQVYTLEICYQAADTSHSTI